MKKTLFICAMILFWVFGLLIVDAKAQIAYGLSIVRINTETRIVDGYSGTALDYVAGLYYDPAVQGDLYRTDQNETSLDSRYHEGYADLIAAEVYLLTTNFVAGKTYCTFGQHFVRAYFYYTTYSQWFDPFRYSTFVYTGGNNFPGYPFSYYYYFTRRYRLGFTNPCITIPNQPTPTPTPPVTPTPTPPATPTPTPTPCNPNVTGTCQVSAFLTINPDVIKPKGTGGSNQTATVKVCTDPATANQNVSLQLLVGPEFRNSGGHVATHHSGSRPLGKLNRTVGRTATDGCFSTLYYPSHISSVITVNARIWGNPLNGNLIVGEFDTQPLNEIESYRLVGSLVQHPSNHWGTPGANAALLQIANDYNQENYGGGIPPLEEKIAYNDMSLTMEGKFDLNRKWLNTGGHNEHRQGTSCDVRSNNIPRRRWDRLLEIFTERGSRRTLDETNTSSPHWHLRFEDPLPNIEDVSGLKHGIERNPAAFVELDTVEITPHSFVEDAWEVLDRGSTQEEWQAWHDRLVLAKAQGPAQLLAEVKVLEQTLFSLSEYVARNRTSREFVEDVFWSHMFRAPTESEINYWDNYFHNLPPILTPQRKRMRLLAEFEDTPEFEEIVYSIVDSNVLEEPAL